MQEDSPSVSPASRSRIDPTGREAAARSTGSRWAVTASLLGLLAVGAGALGAHALKGRIPAEKLSIFEVAVRYQMYHALALLAVSWVMAGHPSRAAWAAGQSMLWGTILFSGSLYGLSLTDWRWLGPLTPLGGVLLMVGWLLLAISATGGKRAFREGDTAPYKGSKP